MAINKYKPHRSSSSPQTPRLFPWVPVLVFMLLACAIGGTGYFVFSRYQASIKEEAHITLGAIANLKVHQIESWRQAYLANGEALSRDPFLAMEIERWLQRGAALDDGAQNIVQRLKAAKHARAFQAVFILDEHGTVMDLPVTPGAEPPAADGGLVARQAMGDRRVILTDIHMGAGAPHIHLNLVAPIFSGGREQGRAIAAIYFRIDPQQYLFPLLQSWATPSPSAETMLVRREGDEVVYLNNLRHRDNTAMQLRFPVTEKTLLASMMARGQEGLIEGDDYRKIPAIAATRKIRDSPWFMVVKMDKEELYAPIRRIAWIVTILVLTFITGAGVATGLWWRQQRARLVARQYQDELRHQTLMQRKEGRIRLLLESTAEAIYGVDMAGNITFANPACLHLLGYEREDELLGQHAHRLFHFSHAEGSNYPLEKYRAHEAHLNDQGVHVDDAVFWRKDGTSFHVEYRSHPIRQEGRVEGAVVTFMDITERRETQLQLRLLKRAMESSINAICIIDTRQEDYPVFYVNPAFEHTTGFSGEEVIGKHCRLLDDGELNQPQISSIYQAIHGQHDGSAMLRGYRKDGGLFWFDLFFSPVRDESSKVTHFIGILNDITVRKRTEEALQISKDLLQCVVETTPVRIFWKDRDSRYLGCNTAFAQDAGFSSPDELIGKTDFDLWKDQAESYRAEDKTTMESGSPKLNFEIQHTTPHGNTIWLSTSKVPLRDENHTIIGILGIYQDITQRKHYESQLERQANYDELTGLANRNLLQDRLSQALAFSRRHDCGLAVLFIDLDNFKNINDSLGHDAGDLLLVQVAARLVDNVREGDTVARQGGDEFVLLLPEIRAEEDIPEFMQKLVKTMSAPFDIGGHELRITCSIGIASYPKDGEDSQTLLKNADAAMYRAKELGRNNAQYYAAEMNVKAMERLVLENGLYHALERDEFILHYQPQVDLRTGEIAGMEALVRWQHPELGLVSPAMFIPVAEDSGVIVALGEWVLRTACAQNKAWQLAGHKPISVAVNLSARQFRQPDLVEKVAAILDETGLEPACLELELTESLVMQDVEKTIATLSQLKAMGIKLSIDDFGTGYSSLSYLKRFPINTLKIDRSFVRDIITDPDDAAIAKSIISMAHDMQLRVIAEGVETEAQKSFLQQRRCDEMQGYFFSKPVVAAEFEKLLRSGHRMSVDNSVAGLGQRTLLLLDDEENILTSLTRLLRRDDYKILKATSAAAAFELLAAHPVGVIVSDQRMPEMNGVEFLRRVKHLYPDTVRMVLSGYTDLKSVTDAINEGAVYKFLTKPWDDELLRANIQEAFQRHDLTQDNQRLGDEMASISEELNRAKRELEMRTA